MKQSIIDIVTQTAEYEIDNDFDPDVGIYPTAEITNPQEVAEDVIKAYLKDIWIPFDTDRPEEDVTCLFLLDYGSQGKSVFAGTQMELMNSGGFSFVESYANIKLLNPEFV